MSDERTCAITQPARVDGDEMARDMAWELFVTAARNGIVIPQTYTKRDHWECMGEPMRDFWRRAAAKEMVG